MNDVAVRQPISHSGQLIGLIAAQRASRAESLGGEADAALEEVACEVGVALDQAHLDSLLQASFEPPRIPAAELQASRGRLVAAADAERRRIERNLTLAPGVADDGAGFDTSVRGGAGLTNMRDRLGAVGGRYEWSRRRGRGRGFMAPFRWASVDGDRLR